VLNKIDVNGLAPGFERDEYGRIGRIWVSARTGEGFDLLREALAEYSRQHQAEAAQAVAQASAGDEFDLTN